MLQLRVSFAISLRDERTAHKNWREGNGSKLNKAMQIVSASSPIIEYRAHSSDSLMTYLLSASIFEAL